MIVVSDWQKSKQSFSILVTFDGIIRDAKLVQIEKQFTGRIDTDDGIVIVVNDSQL